MYVHGSLTLLSYGIIFLMSLLSVKIISAGSNPFNAAKYSIIAEFVSIDYLWDSNHTKSDYEKNDQYIEKNNALAGVKVDSKGNIYATVPRWKSGVPATLSKVVSTENGYVLSPWPSWDFQTIGETGKLQNCQSMTIDTKGNMWVIETGRRNFNDAIKSHTVNGPAGFFVINIDTEEIIQSYYFPSDVVSYDSSFLNDIVLDETNGYVYFTNAMNDGGIVVYNTNTKQSKQFTSQATQRNASYDFCVDGKCYGTDSAVGMTPSDGIALNVDNSILYWSPVQGQGLYSIETKYLHDFTMTNDVFQSNVKFVGFKNGQSDGMLMIGDNLYFGSIKDSALQMISSLSKYDSINHSLSEDQSITVVQSSDDLRWIDTFAINPQYPTSSLYLTSNRLDLFFTFKMDFSGKSGSNFRIIRVDF